MTTSPAHPQPDRRRRLLVCGFGPFPGFADNPAARVVERLGDGSWAPVGADVAFQLIPTTWSGGHAIAAEAAQGFGADAILVLGVAGGADRFRVEGQARNCAGLDRPDAVGEVHPTPHIDARGPVAAPSTAPLEAMVAAIEAEDLPVAASADAGDYLCNYVFYRLLTGAAAARVAFLHLPPGLPLGDLVRGAKAAANALALVVD